MRFQFFTAFILILAPPLAAADCSIIANNVLPACGFESPAEVADWTLEIGSSLVHAPGQGETGGAARGTSALNGFSTSVAIQSPCVEIEPSQSISFGSVVRRVDGATDIECVASLRTFSDYSCLAPDAIQGLLVNPIGNTYVLVSDQAVAGPTTHSVRSNSLCVASSASAFTVDFDNAFIVPDRVAVVDVPALDWVGLLFFGALLSIAAIGVLNRR